MKDLKKYGVQFVVFAGMFVGALLLIRWGDDNDIPGLTDAYDVLN